MANAFLDKNPGSLKNVVPDDPIRIYPNVYLLPSHEFQLKAMLNTAIEQLINSGRVDELILKYAGQDSGFYHVAKPFRK